MAKTIDDVFYRKSFSKKTDSVTSFVSEIRKAVSSYGDMQTRHDRVLSSKTGAVVKNSFDVIFGYDNSSYGVYAFDILVEGTRALVNIKALVHTRLETETITFNDFYIKHMYDDVRRIIKNRMKKDIKEMEDFIEKL